MSSSIANDSVPLHAIALDKEVLRVLKSTKSGISGDSDSVTKWFPVQRVCLPYLLNQKPSSLPPRDVCICAPTGKFEWTFVNYLIIM